MRTAKVRRLTLQALSFGNDRYFDRAFKRPIKPVCIRKLVAFIDEAKRHDGQT